MRGDSVAVGAVVMASSVGRTAENLAAMESYILRAERQSLDIVLFPELCLTGYTTKPEIREAALSRNDPAVERLAALANKTGVTVLAGMAERDNDRIYASHLVARPSGAMGVYRKLHLSPPEQDVFSYGSETPVFVSESLRFGVQLCYDAHFPELSTLYALKGVDAVFMPHASPNGDPELKLQSWLRHLTARAYDNSVFIVAGNLCGDNGLGLSFPGTALFIGPDGNVATSMTTQTGGMLVHRLRREELDAVRGHRMRYFLPNRRPELYGDLAKRETGENAGG